MKLFTVDIPNIVTVTLITIAACRHLGGLDGVAATLAFCAVCRAISKK